jgi:predicted Zn finger-like uncharacterized protein
MKFLCEKCKAKYQIADEKAAGKTVRMKCRKCGHLIEVRAAITESSVSSVPPRRPDSPDASGASGASGAAKGGIPRPSNKPAAPAARVAPLATSLAAAKPATKPERPAGALASAFTSTVQREEEISAPFDMSELSPSDEWYVAINGVPVGPIRVGEVRRKAALGAVTEESLCWQEGLDEWRPVRAFPELAAIVREAAASGRASLTPPPPGARPSVAPAQPRSSTTRPAGQPAAPPRPPARPAAPAPAAAAAAALTASAPQPPARSNVVPITSRLAVAEKLAEAPEDLTVPYLGPPITADSRPASAPAAVVPDPFAMPPHAPATVPATAAKPASEPAAASGVAIAAPATVPPEGEPSPAGAQGRKSPPWTAIAMIAAAMAFAVTSAIAIFLRPAQQVVVQVPAPTVTAAPANGAPVAAAAPTTTESAAPAPTVTTASAARPVAMGGPRTPAAAPPEPRRGPIDLHGLAGSTSISPTDDPGSDGPRAPGQCLSSGQVQQVIGLHQVGLRRSCWERNQTSKPAVNVSVSLTVGPDGSAQNVSASSDDASVGKCIENEVRGWRFPAMGCSQQMNIPFHFVRQ